MNVVGRLFCLRSELAALAISTSSPRSFSAHAKVPPPIPEPMITTSAVSVSIGRHERARTQWRPRGSTHFSPTPPTHDEGLLAGRWLVLAAVLIDRGTAELGRCRKRHSHRRRSRGTVHVAVDPDRASLCRPRVAEPCRCCGSRPGAEPVTGGVGDLHRLVEIGEADDPTAGSDFSRARRRPWHSASTVGE